MTILLDWENQKKKYSKFIFELHVFEVWEKYTELKKIQRIIITYVILQPIHQLHPSCIHSSSTLNV